MNLTSPAFGRNEQIPTRYTCDGENIHPPLEISEPPRRVKKRMIPCSSFRSIPTPCARSFADTAYLRSAKISRQSRITKRRLGKTPRDSGTRTSYSTF